MATNRRADPAPVAEPLRHAARELALRSLLLGPAAAPSPERPRLTMEVVHAAQQLAAALDGQTAPLGPADAIVLNIALFDLARLGRVVDDHDRSTVNALATRLAVQLREHGVPLDADLPGSEVVANAGDASARLKGVVAAVTERIDALRDSLGEHEPKTVLHHRIAAHAPLLSELLAEVGDAAREQGRRDGKIEKEVLKTVNDSVALLSMRCHQLGLEMVPSQLDRIFDAEDRAYQVVGAPAPNWRALYYRDWNATDFDEDRGHRDPEAKRGEHLVNQIVTWFESGAILQALLLPEAAAIVIEPPMKRDTSTLEKVLTYAVGSLLGVVPGLLDDLVKRGVGRWLGEAREAEHGPERVTASLVRALAPAVAKPTTRELQKGAKAMVAAPAALPPLWPRGEGPLSTAFLRLLAVEGIADLKARVAASGGLRDALTLVPPAGLQALWDSLTDDLAAQVARGSQALAREWANVVAASIAGDDDEARPGVDLETLHERPGTVRVDVAVRTTPAQAWTGAGLRVERRAPALTGAEVRSMRVGGLGPTALARIRESAEPLATVGLHRLITVHAPGADGGFEWRGEFAVDPDGAIAVPEPSIAGLAQLGRAVPIGDDTVGAAMASVDRGAADAAARWILSVTGATTAALQGP